MDLGSMLSADDHRMYPLGDAIAVLHGDLGLPIGPEVRYEAILPHLCQSLAEPVRQAQRQGHQLGSLITREPNHHPLVTCAYAVHILGVTVDYLLLPRFQGASDPRAYVLGTAPARETITPQLL